jgi:hypothetical protein
MDYFVRYAQKVIILVDAQAIVFLQLCWESTGLLLWFSLELSKYIAEFLITKITESLFVYFS